MLQESHQIPIGAKVCFSQLNSENNEENKPKDSAIASTSKDTNLIHESCMEPNIDFVPDDAYITLSDVESSLLISESLPATLETHPLLFRLKKSNFQF